MKHSFKFKTVAVFLSFLVAIVTLMPVMGSNRVSAQSDPYQPKTDESPAYTGPLTWVDFTSPYYNPYSNSYTTLSVSESVYVPFSITIDGSNNMYMGELGSQSDMNVVNYGKVEMMSLDTKVKTDLTYDGDFHYISSIAVGPEGNVYVTDNTLYFFGELGSQSDNIASIWMLEQGSEQWTNITSTRDFKYASGIATDKSGNVYVIDSYLNIGFNSDENTPNEPIVPAILKLNTASQESPSWIDITGNLFQSNTENDISSAIDLAVDGAGNLFVTTFTYHPSNTQDPNNTQDPSNTQDSGNSEFPSRIFKLPAYSNSWTNISPTTTFEVTETTQPTMFIPFGIEADPYDNIVAMNFFDNTVMKLNYNGGEENWVNMDVLPTAPSIPYFNFSLASDNKGYLYRVDLTTFTIKKMLATLIYDGNGALGTPEAVAGYEANATATAAGQGNLTNGDLSFNGWNTELDGSGDNYAPNAPITMTENTILYAQWLEGPTVSAIDLDSSAYSLYIGGTHQTAVTAQLSDQSTTTPATGVTYNSSDAGVATVDTTGLVTAVATGQTVITATYQGHEAHVDVTVKLRSSAPVVNNSVEIIVDGVKQEQLATAKNETVNGVTVTTIQIDSQKVIDKLNREQNKVLTIPVKSDSKVIAGQLNGSLVKAMQAHEAIIEIVTDNASYSLPASQIDIDGISAQIGKNVSLDDMVITIQLSESSDDQKAQVEASAGSNNYQIIGAPLNFEVTASYGTQSVDVNRFNSYVERTIAIPDGVDPSQITTGVVLTNDGELFHVPTSVVDKDGKYYAQINSLTNSTYSVIYNPKTMKDVEGHWAQAAVNDMTSRLIIRGVTSTEFDPDAAITRAEFAAILTRALGIQGKSYGGVFTDVDASASLSDAVQAAVEYQLINGYEDASFRPDQTITRQEAAVVLARALSIANLDVELSSEEVSTLLAGFADDNTVAGWAQENVAAAISLNLLNGRNGQLDLGANLTRAEAATLVYRLLTEAGLINE
ncbi:S-layer homology domain-containing protein [Paenibacillus sp. HB172176]|uniref:S-layer homology domain-containing protein n=1 Tax=Paenibacillus sp. HB172176 TaxID=2493690 RepID=UPI001439AD4C|nr:S-layer homology domain-containing protein [Paenibacillus sp. HB172176]